MKKLLLSLLTLTCSIGLYAQEQFNDNSYDFWVGKWNLSWEDAKGNKGSGTNYIHKILDGKVIEENFEAKEGLYAGMKGKSLSVYNPQTKKWHQAWADSQGSYFDFYGAEMDGHMVFRTKEIKKDDKVIIQRMVFKDVTEDSLTWDWEITTDGGKTWNLSWRIKYSRES